MKKQYIRPELNSQEYIIDVEITASSTFNQNFGNDNDEVDVIAKDIIDDFAQICDELQSVYKTPAGISTFGRQLE